MGLPTRKAVRISTGTDVSNARDAQVKFPMVEGIAENDVVLVAFPLVLQN